MNYAEILREKNLQAEKLQQEIVLLQKLQQIEVGSNVILASKVSEGDPKATRRGRPKKNNVSISVEGAVKRGRGRPRRTPVDTAAIESPKRGRGRPRKVVEGEQQEKGKKLPSLIQEIASQEGKALELTDFVALVKASGYKNQSSDLGSMVYQCLRKLVKKEVLQAITENDKRKYVLA